MSTVPDVRIRRLTPGPTHAQGSYVLYWMTATRRLGWNYALDQAVQLSATLQKPLVILEALSAGYRWASDRHHQAIIDGMLEHQRALETSNVHYFPYVEPRSGAGSGLLAALAESACALITDDSPVFFTGRLLEAASRLHGIRVEAVDSCGMLPVRAVDKAFTAAYHFRRRLQKELPSHLGDLPSADGLSGVRLPRLDALPSSVTGRWAPTPVSDLESSDFVRTLPIDHSVGTTGWVGGTTPARAAMLDFTVRRLPRYAEDRNHPDLEASSGLSTWLHYGHISAHEVFRAVAEAEGWTPLRLSEEADGRRQGWWGMSDSAEAFLDQLITWRELGYGYCTHSPDFARYESLPDWARATLEDHASDPREHTYSLEQFTNAQTHDELWNAAQRQLVRDGRIHNYLRMLWGKKILEWTEHPRESLDVMIELNNRYAIDGRDPNSFGGIFWTMGRFDRGWPERSVFGKVRSMTSASTRRKVSVDEYLGRWSHL